jgi:acetyltransferase-like isoleucine patch superfamily enzyme
VLPVIFDLFRKVRWGTGSIWAKIVLRSYGVVFNPNISLGSTPYIKKNPLGAKIVIGSHVTINNESAQNPMSYGRKTILAAPNPDSVLIIGDRVVISGATIFAAQRIEIEDDVMLGPDCVIYDTDFHAIHPAYRTYDPEGLVGIAPVLIKRNVWIGARAIVLKGVTVGQDAVVAAGAIVTKDVPQGAVVAGVPAKVVGWAAGYQEVTVNVTVDA